MYKASMFAILLALSSLGWAQEPGASPETQAAMKKLGFEPRVGSPQEFAAFIRKEMKDWTPAAKAAGILAK